jgi:hypothetical protein
MLTIACLDTGTLANLNPDAGILASGEPSPGNEAARKRAFLPSAVDVDSSGDDQIQAPGKIISG